MLTDRFFAIEGGFEMGSVDETSRAYAKIMEYVDANPAAVLGTADKDGALHGAVIYVMTASHGTLCFVTKNQTRKYQDVIEHPQVSLTFFDEKDSSTLQVTGQAFVADNPALKDMIMDKMAKLHAIRSEWLPPVTKVKAGEYAVMGIEITYARLTDFQSTTIDGEPTITEL